MSQVGQGDVVKTCSSRASGSDRPVVPLRSVGVITACASCCRYGMDICGLVTNLVFIAVMVFGLLFRPRPD